MPEPNHPRLKRYVQKGAFVLCSLAMISSPLDTTVQSEQG